eukprot:COSAG01_NODE_2685_length_7253_cov_6.363153_8_plen_79_part_00
MVAASVAGAAAARTAMAMGLLVAMAAGAVVLAAATPPNVLILFVDDWGWGDLGANCMAMEQVRASACCLSRSSGPLSP